jgi:hypothetical protein
MPAKDVCVCVWTGKNEKMQNTGAKNVMFCCVQHLISQLIIHFKTNKRTAIEVPGRLPQEASGRIKQQQILGMYYSYSSLG